MAKKSLTFDRLRKQNVLRCQRDFPQPLNAWSPSDWVCALTGELGEAANLIKKRRRGDKINTQDIAHELADAMTYLDLLAARLGIDLGKAVREKFNIVSERRGSRIRL
jgi:NTP pyrophosphatase (non-canonical NTP hydrolase)